MHQDRIAGCAGHRVQIIEAPLSNLRIHSGGYNVMSDGCIYCHLIN